MEKEFIPYELAVKLKELGFDEPCFGYYLCENSAFGVRLEITTNWIDLLPYDSSSCKAPLYQQAFRWFREKGYRFNMINDVSQVDGDYFYDVWFNGNFIFESHYIDKTYEEAELACLTKLIEIVKQNKN